MSEDENGLGLSVVGRDEERKSYTEREVYVAYVRVRAKDVLSIEDLPKQNPEAGIGKNAPLKINIGCIVQLRHASKPVRLRVLADEFQKAVLEAEETGTDFVIFPWVDPDGKTSI